MDVGQAQRWCTGAVSRKREDRADSRPRDHLGRSALGVQSARGAAVVR